MREYKRVKYWTNDKWVNYLNTLSETCALDMARVERTLQEVADILGVSRERVRQIIQDVAGPKLRECLKEFRCEIQTSSGS